MGPSIHLALHMLLPVVSSKLAPKKHLQMEDKLYLILEFRKQKKETDGKSTASNGFLHLHDAYIYIYMEMKDKLLNLISENFSKNRKKKRRSIFTLFVHSE